MPARPWRQSCGAVLVSDLRPDPSQGTRAPTSADLTQGYSARLLEKGTVAAADPDKGRLRSFLLADCSFFLADRRDRDRALKRGGAAGPVDRRPRRRGPLPPRAVPRPDSRTDIRARLGHGPDRPRLRRAGTALRRDGAIRPLPPAEAFPCRPAPKPLRVPPSRPNWA